MPRLSEGLHRFGILVRYQEPSHLGSRRAQRPTEAGRSARRAGVEPALRSVDQSRSLDGLWLAEGEGFEPSVPLAEHVALAGRWAHQMPSPSNS